MKPMKTPKGLRVTTLLTLASLVTSMLVVGCPPGTRTSIEAGVSATVDPQHCTEVKGDVGLTLNTSTNVVLDCTTLTGSGVIRIEFPRKSWWDIKRGGATGADAGPGK